jgi:hypothetical protein
MWEALQLPKCLLLLGGQREIFIALFLRKARKPVERVYFLLAEDDKTLAGILRHSIHVA